MPVLPKLPSPFDAQAVGSYIISTFGVLVTFLTLMHVGLPTGTSNLVQVWAPVVGMLVAFGAQAFNLITHRSAHKAVAVAQAVPAVVVPPALTIPVASHLVP
jgi:protein-S-isoprenylcysteine O-methyltransferase Ste14